MVGEIIERLKRFSELIRLTKQYGTLLLLLPTLWSLFIAFGGSPSLKLFIIFVLGSFLMRSAGCAINDVVDRDIDPYVKRTKDRPIASGRLSPKEGILIFIIFITISFILTLFLNRLCILLSVFGLILAVIYPFMKRFLYIPQVFLGIAFGWGAIMAWAAVKERIELPAIIILITNIFWATGYDTIYALMDIEDDKRLGIKSTAILFGRYILEGLGVLFLFTILGLITLGIITDLGVVYYISLGIAALIFTNQIRLLKRSRDLQISFKAFVSNVFVGSVVLAGIIIDYLLQS